MEIGIFAEIPQAAIAPDNIVFSKLSMITSVTAIPFQSGIVCLIFVTTALLNLKNFDHLFVALCKGVKNGSGIPIPVVIPFQFDL